MKQSILFVAHTMNIGGVEKALLAELASYSPKEYDIHIALLEKKGDLLSKLPPHITLHEISFYKENKHIFNNPPLSNIKSYLQQKQILFALKLLYAYICYKLTRTQKVLFNLMFSNVEEFPIEFDKVLAYAGPFPFIDYFVTKKVKAKEKQVWIHYDISKINPDNGIINKLYLYYDKINIVSNLGKEIFDKTFPQYTAKSRFYPNKINKKEILELADELENPFANYNGINIVTVGRVSKEKGQSMTLEVLKSLLESKYNVFWHYIGDGNDLENCKKKSQELGVNNKTFFYGAIANPYPYMKHCDIYVQPSKHEGFCITLSEAKLFDIPIITTDFTGAKEQLGNYNHSWDIVNYSSDSLFKGIVNIIKVNDSVINSHTNL